MTTPLHKPVRRALDVIPRRGSPMPYVVELTRDGVRYRERGRRTWLFLPHASAILKAATLEADRVRAERLARRKERKDR